MPLPIPQNIFRFDDRETFVFWGNNLIGNTQLFQFLSTMPPPFAVGRNMSGARFLKGQAVSRGPDAQGYVLADNSVLDRQAIGLCCEIGDPEFSVIVQLLGQFCLQDWTDVTGTTELLPRTTYWLSATPGIITPIQPAGPIVQRIGYSISPLVLNLNLEFPGSGSSSSGAPSVAPAWFLMGCGC